jgi:hypothetical protein
MQLRPRAIGLALAAIAALGARAGAQTTFVGKVQVYVDSDHTQVVSPLVRAATDVTPTTNISTGYVADVVTSASVDIVTQASKTTIHDTRHQASFGVDQILGSFTARAGYTYSTENDYRSHNVDLGLERRLASNDTTLAIGWALSLDTVGRAGDANYHDALTVNEASLAWTQVLSPEVVLQLTYDLAYNDGMMASQYRFVPVRTASGAPPLMWIAETDPRVRARHALVAAVNWHVGEDTAIQADDRVYVDTWGITSDTAELRVVTGLAPGFELRVGARGYVQSGASFYRVRYADLERYMTIDRELSALWSATGGAKLAVKLGADVEIELKADLFYYRYPNFPLLPSRTGANLGAGVGVHY